MSLSVRRNADGTIIDIDSTPLVQGEQQPTGYLLDLGEKPEDGGSIELFWQADGARGSSSVMVQQSPDLQRWRVLVAQTTLVDLEYGGSRVVQRKIELPRRPERYLKIVWLPQQPPLKLQQVTVASRPPVSRQNMQWATLYNGAKSRVDAQTVIDFQSPYRLPVRSVRFQFPEMNSIVSASLQSRRDPEAGWREQCRGVFYTLEVNGARVQSEPCSFRTVSDREWRLVVLDDGAGLGGGDRNLTLDLGWQSDELLFLARGTGPFMLAFGSGRLENGVEKAGADMVLLALRQQEGNLVLPAMVGKRLTLGGDEALVAPPPATPWRTWLLWGVLVAGVIGMAGMAFSLMKELRPKRSQ